WPGFVRQVVFTCRWLTVMAAGLEVVSEDRPSALFESPFPDSPRQMLLESWSKLLGEWADLYFRSGHQYLLSEAKT
ncbi:nitrogen regulation protein NR(I), partial [Klebsiella pneumoniae]|nr:nitrogen regulation protein NR(I) [Klebsiella pneumoniae]